ncbi:MAG TPA: class I SAM-dependent methyltransferase [Hanamia sp.]
MPENFNNNYSRYYDLLYKDKDYKVESDYIIKLIRSLNPLAKNIIELGSGTGNHAAKFCKQDFTVTGLERSENMVLLANEKAIEGFTSILADICDFNIEQKFDVAVSLFHVISYLTKNELLLSCFNNVNKYLNKGGIFIFDAWYTAAVYYEKPETRIKRLENEELKITRLAEPVINYNENIIDVNYEIIVENKTTKLTEVYKEKHPMRHFSIPEIALLAKQTGFGLLKTEEFLTGRPASEHTWAPCFILQKI